MKKVRLKHPDIFQLAYATMQLATDEKEQVEPESTKNPAAVALGRLGGLRGGVARAKKLTPERRKEIAQAAINKRWHKEK